MPGSRWHFTARVGYHQAIDVTRQRSPIDQRSSTTHADRAGDWTGVALDDVVAELGSFTHRG
jgi:hypothetical protein